MACAKMAGDQPSSMLEKVFYPGRVVQLQLSTESLRASAQGMSAAPLSPYAGNKCIPNWSTLGVVLEVKKAVGWVMVCSTLFILYILSFNVYNQGSISQIAVLHK